MHRIRLAAGAGLVLASFLSVRGEASAAPSPAPAPAPSTVLREPLRPSLAPVEPGNAVPGLPSLRGIRRYHRAEIDPGALLRRLEGFRQGSFRLDLGGGHRWDLELEPSPIRAPGYVVRHLTSGGIRTVAPSQERTFRGHVRGRPDREVRLSFHDGRVHGFVDAGDSGRVFVEPMDLMQAGLPSTSHAVYRDGDVIPDPGATCGMRPAGGDPSGAAPSAPVHPGAWPVPTPVPGASPASPVETSRIAAPGFLSKMGAEQAGAEACGMVELAIAADYSMVRNLGSAAAVEKRITDIYNMVDGLYQDARVNITVRISEVVIETEARNTWGGVVDINRYLESLTSWMTGANGFKKPFDVASLWYHHLGSGTVGLAYVGVICGRNRSNVIRYYTTASRGLMIDAAHELGHNFNAPHISNPNWIMNPSITGVNDKWDESTIATVVAHKKSRTCLSACMVSPIAGFAVKGPSACADTRSFTDLTTGEPTAWLWQFGDGTSSSERNPVHTYAVPGNYTATLSASNAYGASSASRSQIRVKPVAPPTALPVDGCPGQPAVLEAKGAGTLRWYDSASGGVPLAVGPRFQTPALSRARAYYVEDAEPDAPSTKVGPASSAIGAGQLFTATGDRRLFFDVRRPATLVSAKVRAGAAGPRTVEILDSKDRRILVRTVQVSAGESRIPLGFELDPGEDYAIKVVGSGDSVNLFRNSAGADYPYVSPDSLIAITGSDAAAADSVTQRGYYYFFYDWEVRERACASPRVPVAVTLGCTSTLADASSTAFSAALAPLAPGLWRLRGRAPEGGTLHVTLRTLDGALVSRASRPVAAGDLQADLALGGPASGLLIADLRLGKHTLRTTLLAR